MTSQPGEQGIATQPEEKKEALAKVWDRSPSQEEIAFASDELLRLKESAQDMGAEAVIDALIKVMDVHPSYQMPREWPGKPDVTHHDAKLLKQAAAFMCRGCARIEIPFNHLLLLWYNKKAWTEKGVQVRCKAKPLGELSVYLADGKTAAIIGNYQIFRLLNTRQKLAALYSALRQLDADGKIKPPHFTGFFDELELFGTGTHQTDVLMRRAMEHGAQRDLPFTETLDAITLETATSPDERDEDEGEED